jgi:hypothetical protein
MSLEIKGNLEQKSDTVQVSDKFKKREFVLAIHEEINGNLYTNYAKFQLSQNKCDLIDRCQLGELLKVSFNVKGNSWERDGKVNYITNLDVWRVDSLGVAQQPQQQPQQQPAQQYQPPAPPPQLQYGNYPSPEILDDLPF